MLNHEVVAALDAIRAGSPDGVLREEDVVQEARRPTHPLHDRFEWDDTKAAHAHRLAQARELIRVAVTVLPGQRTPVRAFVSLPNDRTPEGGYRRTEDVLTSADLRAQLLAGALAELRALEARYGRLEELAEVFSAARQVHEATEKRAQARGKRKVTT